MFYSVYGGQLKRTIIIKTIILIILLAAIFETAVVLLTYFLVGDFLRRHTKMTNFSIIISSYPASCNNSNGFWIQYVSCQMMK